jgi:hypothetical protein
VSLSSLLVDGEEFEPLHCSEEILEGLLRTYGTMIFPGFRYFDFRPPVLSRAGTRHPDGALVAPGHERWWVVEVEVHTHSVADHIEPQLGALRDGHYGPTVFGYLDRHDGFEASAYASIDSWQPYFLLIVDEATAEIRAAAERCEFRVVECAVLRSQRSRYALAVTGDRPRLDVRPLPTGVDVIVDDEFGICVLRPVLGVTIPTTIPEQILVGDRAIRKRVTQSGTAVALAIERAEIDDLAGSAELYRLTFDGQLLPVPDTP